MSMRSAASCGQPAHEMLAAARRADRRGSCERSDLGFDGAEQRARRDQLLGRGEVGRQPAVGARPGDARAQRGAAPRAVPAPGCSGARRSSPRAGADELDREDAREVRRRRCAACAPRPSPSRRGPPASRWSGSESTLAGAARRRFSATIAACVYWAIIRPEFTPASSVEERRQAVRAARRRAAGRCGARRSRRPRRRRWRGSRRRSRAARRGSCRTTRPGRPAAPSGCRSPTRSSAAATPLGVVQRVARGAGDLRRAAQRVGVLHAGVAVAVAGDDRRAGQQRAQVRRARRLARLRAQRDEVLARTRGRCRAAPRPTSPR